MLTLSVFPDAFTGNFMIRLLAAALLGAAIGFERDIHGRAAGLRTHILLSLGAAAFMIISQEVALRYAGEEGESVLRADPGRIAAQIITGIGFLGAGAIIKEGFSVRGLTTAACVWLSAGIGMAAGAGLFEIALVVTLLGLVTLVLLNILERYYAKDSYRVLEIVTSNEDDLSLLIQTVKRPRVKILYLDFERDYEHRRMRVVFNIRLFHKGVTDKLSHGIVHDLELTGKTFHSIKWWH